MIQYDKKYFVPNINCNYKHYFIKIIGCFCIEITMYYNGHDKYFTFNFAKMK
jgi:hypothetical protein